MDPDPCGKLMWIRIPAKTNADPDPGIKLQKGTLTMPLPGQLVVVEMEAGVEIPITVERPAPHLHILQQQLT